jgi:hypothetical protein
VFLDSCVSRFVQERQLACGDALRFDLEQRSARLTQKLAPLTVREPSAPFGDVAHHAERRPPQLRREAIRLLPRKRRRDFVDNSNQFQRTLKRREILECFAHACR